MKIKSFIQNNFMAVVALAIAGASLTVMSFRDGDKEAQSNLYWYQKNQVTGTYSFDRHAAEPSSGCPPIGDENCAKGFSSMQSNPNTITDETPAVDRYLP